MNWFLSHSRHKCLPIVILACLMLLLSVPIAANALLYNYSYTGNALTGGYDSVPGGYYDGLPRALSITFKYDGDILAGAYNNTLYPSVTPYPKSEILFEMSNGVTTLSSETSNSLFGISNVDANGLPQQWWIVIQGNRSNTIGDTSELLYSDAGDTWASDMSLRYTYSPTGGLFGTGGHFVTEAATNSGQAGTWSRTPDISSVPEPSTIVLLVAGLLGLAVYGKKRICK